MTAPHAAAPASFASSPQPSVPGRTAARPWHREPMVWLVIAGPLAVVVASLASAVIAWKHIDPVILDPVQGRVHVQDDMSRTADPGDPLAPAKTARNHVGVPHR